MTGLEKTLRLLFALLALFDFVLGTLCIFFGERVFAAAGLAPYASPQFFMICTGLFLYQYVYIQTMAAVNPRRYATCLNMTVVIRLSFPVLYITQIFLWGMPGNLLQVLFLASAAGDLAVSAFVLFALRRLGIPFFRGDEYSREDRGPRFLRFILIVLAVSEFLISWNWLVFGEFWLKLFHLSYTVDPFWTRATGLFLLNIAYIQYLGYYHVYRFRTATVTSRLFRALWPLLYWYWAAWGEGSTLFKGFILFFSFFDTAMFITQYYLLKKAENPTGRTA